MTTGPSEKSKRRTGSSREVLETFDLLTRIGGVQPVPIPLRSKGVVPAYSNYPQPDYQPPPRSAWEQNNWGIGAKLFPLCDVDCDCAEARELAPRFFPPTPFRFGREGAEGSHLGYRVDTEFYHPFTDPVRMKDKDPATRKRAMVIELRARPHLQTVMPGSIHKGGKPIRFETPDTIPLPTPSDEMTLYRAAAKTAITTLVARYLWSDGSRNQVLLPLAGLLCHAGWEEHDAFDLISAVADQTHDDDTKNRLTNVRGTFRKDAAGKNTTGGPTLKKLVGDEIGKELVPAVDAIQRWARGPDDGVADIVLEYNERFAIVDVDGRFRVARTDVRPSEPLIFYQKSDFLDFNSFDYTTVGDKRVQKAKLWLNHSDRRFYQSVAFQPGLEEPGNCLNLWTGWAVAPKQGDCSGWLELLRDVICGGDEPMFKWVLHWLAAIVREPMEISRTSLALIGKQGAGKSLLLEYFGEILGSSHFLMVSNPDHVHGRFNKHLAATLLLHSAEALYAGDKKHRAIIKSLITDKTRMLEIKGVDAIPVLNYLRLVLTSNDRNPAPVEVDDRRFTVIDMGLRKVSEELKDRVVAEMKGDGPAALFHYLTKELEYDRSVAQTNVKNEAHAEVKQQNYDPVAAWWFDTLSSGCLLPEYLKWASMPEEEPWPPVAGCTALYMAFQIWAEGQRHHSINQMKFGTDLNLLLRGKTLNKAVKDFVNPRDDVIGWPTKVRSVPDRGLAITNFPSLSDCRAMFEQYVGHPIEWPDPIEPEPTDPDRSKNRRM